MESFTAFIHSIASGSLTRVLISFFLNTILILFLHESARNADADSDNDDACDCDVFDIRTLLARRSDALVVFGSSLD